MKCRVTIRLVDQKGGSLALTGDLIVSQSLIRRMVSMRAETDTVGTIIHN